MRRFLIALVAGFVVVAVVLTPERADSASVSPPRSEVSASTIPTVALNHKPTDLGVQTVVIQAPAKAWGIRKVAATVDRNVAGLDIWARRGIVCMPTVTCITVTAGNYGAFPTQSCTGRVGESWTGCAQIGGSDPFIWLNTFWGDRQVGVGCHELLHALGLDHHTLPGCVGLGAHTPSEYELAALRGLYG